jgi:hypothetical protein
MLFSLKWVIDGYLQVQLYHFFDPARAAYERCAGRENTLQDEVSLHTYCIIHEKVGKDKSSQYLCACRSIWWRIIRSYRPAALQILTI